MRPILIIGGGVGPMAGLALHHFIIEQTPSEKDQDHLRVLHSSISDMIPDRTQSLAEGKPQAPAEAMAQVLLASEKFCAALGCPGIVGIPCNTFHAPAIWTPFIRLLNEKKSQLRVLHMIEETVSHLKNFSPKIKKVGLLATEGTIKEGIYTKILLQEGIEPLHPSDQGLVHQAIYNKQWGIKANTPATKKSRILLLDQITKLKKLGAELVILACSEIPLAIPETSSQGLVLLNPVAILAKALISSAQCIGEGKNLGPSSLMAEVDFQK